MRVGFFFAVVESDGQRPLILTVVVQRAADEHHLIGGRAPFGPQWLPQDAQPLDRCQHMLHRHSFARQFPVGSPVLPVQRPSARFPVRRAHLGGSGLVALESTVAQHPLVLPSRTRARSASALSCRRPGAVGVTSTTRPPALTTTFLTVVRLRRPL